jgi:hypothetical protein
MRSFKIAAISAFVIVAIPAGQSSAQVIRPVASTPSADALVTQVHSRRHGHHRHGHRGYYGNHWGWAAPGIGLGLSLATPYYYPRQYYAPYYATPYYAQPYYAQPYYGRPYYGRRYYGW